MSEKLGRSFSLRVSLSVWGADSWIIPFMGTGTPREVGAVYIQLVSFAFLLTTVSRRGYLISYEVVCSAG